MNHAIIPISRLGAWVATVMICIVKREKIERQKKKECGETTRDW